MTSSEPLTVVCLKWGEKYGTDYVNKLSAMVRRNLTLPYRFVCMTDNPRGLNCETAPLIRDLAGWWGKITLFSHTLPGRLLFFDLDTVITGNIDGFAKYAGPFCLIKPFYRTRGYASGVMGIAPGLADMSGKNLRSIPVGPSNIAGFMRIHPGIPAISAGSS